MSTISGSAKELKIGKFVVIDDVPCKVVEIQSSAPGKHGSAKMRVTGIGIFDGSKHTLLKPSDGDIEIPVVERKIGQAISVSGDSAQIMDPTSYEMFDLPIPAELKGQVEGGKEIDYVECMGRKMMQKVR
jgi:translation initiation factor 5A